MLHVPHHAEDHTIGSQHPPLTLLQCKCHRIVVLETAHVIKKSITGSIDTCQTLNTADKVHSLKGNAVTVGGFVLVGNVPLIAPNTID